MCVWIGYSIIFECSNGAQSAYLWTMDSCLPGIWNIVNNKKKAGYSIWNRLIDILCKYSTDTLKTRLLLWLFMSAKIFLNEPSWNRNHK